MKTYNPEGKKLTWEQHYRRKKEWETEQKQNEKSHTPKGWLCGGCNKSAFTLKAEPGKLIRTCKHCGEQKIF